jgi:hypothetical protein
LLARVLRTMIRAQLRKSLRLQRLDLGGDERLFITRCS